jgi:hypothetical protein
VQTLDWLLKRVGLAWLILTTAIIIGVLQSIHRSGGWR